MCGRYYLEDSHRTDIPLYTQTTIPSRLLKYGGSM